MEPPLTRCLLESLPQLQPQDLDFQSWAGPSASSRLALVCDSKTNNNDGSDSRGFLGPWYIQSLSFSTWSRNLATSLPEDFDACACVHVQSRLYRQVLWAAHFADQERRLRRQRTCPLLHSKSLSEPDLAPSQCLPLRALTPDPERLSSSAPTRSADLRQAIFLHLSFHTCKIGTT